MPSAIFHQGDLLSGISRAIQEEKVVACFVRGNDEESKRWEYDWLADTTFGDDGRSLGERIGDKAVLLRIDFGSKTARFINIVWPITKAPTLALIQNGIVLEQVESGTEYDEFLAKISRAVGLVPEGSEEHGEAVEGRTRTTGVDEDTLHTDPATATESQAASAELTQSTAQLQQILNGRGAKLGAERKEREAAEKERVKQANARQKAAEQAAEEASSGSRDKGKQRASTERNEQQNAREAWTYQQKNRKEEAKQQQERILAHIEANKRDRKARAEVAKEAQADGGSGASSELPSTGNEPPPARAGNNCSLQVRLFDGSTIRARFAPDADIATAVRTWVKETSPEGGADKPFTFRQILAPLPSRSIKVSEEHQTLRKLGLVPTATLVLVPVAQYTNAYSSAGNGYVGSALTGAYYLASTGYSLLGSILSYVPGFGGAANGGAQSNPSQSRGPYMGGTGDEQDPSNVEGARMANSDSARTGSAQIRVMTLADQRAEAAKKQGAEFYNGNSLKFEAQDEPDSDRK